MFGILAILGGVFAVPSEPPLPVEDFAAVVIEDTRAKDIANAILELEGGCEARGQSGEIGCYQYMPSTWNAYSTEILGYVADIETEQHNITEAKIASWLEEGYTAREIFLLWNQGHSGPCKSGVNKYGVSYDSCAYANEGMSLLEQ